MTDASPIAPWLGEITLRLPWPPRELSPNYRGHWREVADAKAKYRRDCFWTAKGAKIADQMRALPTGALLFVTADFHTPDRRAYDDDNLMARLKSGRDGVADAIGINDARWRMKPGMIQHIGKPGGVILRFRAAPVVEW
jgi:crossover junction endodeoxyribonuclease RusA